MGSSVLDMFSLKGQTAIATGCTRGIGEQMAVALAEAGARLIFVQVSTLHIQRRLKLTPAQRNLNSHPVHKVVEALGHKTLIVTADLSSKTDTAKLINDITSIEEVHPTILLNCAGIQRRHAAEEFPDADWDEVIQVNLSSVFTLARDFGKYLLSRDADETGHRGTIINIASLMTFQGGLNIPAYAAAKGGVAQLTKSLSNEWAGKGIQVNAIAPGYVQTDLTSDLMGDTDRAATILARIPAGRWGKPEDFKGVVVFLASRAGRYVSGEIVTVDGGWMGR